MLASAIVVFREVLEAALIVGIVMAATVGLPQRNFWVLVGIFGGLAGSILVAGFADAIAAAASGMGQEYLNATVLFVAVVVLGWSIVWMRRHGRELSRHAKDVGRGVAAGGVPAHMLAVVIGLSVLREGAETVLFLYGIAAGQGATASLMLLGGAIGVAAGIAVGYLIYRGLVKIAAHHLFGVTSWLLAFLAAGMASQGAAMLVAAGMLPPIVATAWDTSALLSERNILGQILHTLIGYDSNPALVQVLFYVATLAVIAAFIRLFDRKLPLRKGVAIALGIIVILGGGAASARAADREIFVAAEEMAWDYAPAGLDAMMNMPFAEEQKIFVEPSDGRIGRVYSKAIYREYADREFTKPKTRAKEWEHLGLLGPLIHAEVGDTIILTFKNRASRPYSIHPHGVFYDKTAEGAPYADGTDGMFKADDAVPPGATHVYRWSVPERAGPGPADPSSVAWLYHSHVDAARDTNAGLIGAIVITAKGRARADGRPQDIDREFMTLFKIFDENQSWYLEANRARTEIAPAPKTRAAGADDDEDFVESNLKHTVNGYLFANQPGLEMRRGERVRWYVASLGNEVDLHTPHWHGNVGLADRRRVDTLALLPAQTEILDMVPDAPGTWVFHCHVDDHMAGGMSALYYVTE